MRSKFIGSCPKKGMNLLNLLAVAEGKEAEGVIKKIKHIINDEIYMLIYT